MQLKHRVLYVALTIFNCLYMQQQNQEIWIKDICEFASLVGSFVFFSFTGKTLKLLNHISSVGWWSVYKLIEQKFVPK